MSESRLAPLKAWWAARAARERSLLLGAATVIVLVLVFTIAVQPAWRTLRAAPAQIDSLDEQLQAMQRLTTEARELRGQPLVNPVQAGAALKAASERLGDKAKLSIQGERATLTLNGAGTSQLRGWLSEVRLGARARPIEATLTRGPAGYNGSIVVAIGAAP